MSAVDHSEEGFWVAISLDLHADGGVVEFRGSVIRLTRRWAWGATSTAVGTATIRATTKEASQSGTRAGVNPTLTIVSTSDTTSDMTIAMIAETSRGAYLGSRRGAVAFDSSRLPGYTSFAARGWRCPRISVVLSTCLNRSRRE
jgi:hypothetical protein